MLRLTFNSPVPYCERDSIIRGLKGLGLSYERIYQNGTYSLHRFYGRLPEFGEENVMIHFVDDKTREEFKAHGVANSVEIFLRIGRKEK